MADKEVDPYIEETKILRAMGEEDRTRYVEDVISWLSSRIRWVLKAKSKARMVKRFNRMTDEASGRGEELMICALWTIKQEFRTPWMELLGTLVEMEEKGA